MFKTNEEIIVIQAEAKDPIPTKVVFWSHDKGTAKMIFQLQKDYVNQTLSEGTIVPICLDFVGGRHIYHAVIEDAVNGIVSIVLEDNILGYVGRVTGSIYIELPDSRSLDTAGRFTFDIKRSPIDLNTPELEDYYWQGFNQIMDQYHETSNKLFDDLNNTQVKLNEIFNAIEENKVLLKSEADIFFAKKTDLTKENIGLENVDNFTTATQAEAEAGESNSVFMTPKAVFQAIAKWVQGKFVSTTGNETVLGTKNFQDGLQLEGSPVGLVNEACWCEDFAVNNLTAGIVNPDIQRFSTSNAEAFSMSGKTITVKKAGVYLITLGVNYTGLSGWVTFGISRLGGTSLVKRSLLESANSGSNSLTYVRSFEGNDQLTIEFNSGTAGTTMQKINLAIVKLA